MVSLSGHPSFKRRGNFLYPKLPGLMTIGEGWDGGINNIKINIHGNILGTKSIPLPFLRFKDNPY